MAPFVALGPFVSTYFTVAVLHGPVIVQVHAHALEYDVGLDHGELWAVVYVAATIGPAIFSGYPSIVAFGVLNLALLCVVWLFHRSLRIRLLRVRRRDVRADLPAHVPASPDGRPPAAPGRPLGECSGVGASRGLCR